MTAERAYIDETLARLDRAHQMGCSDPNDPAKRTLYSEAADAIRDLLATEAVRRSEAALAKFEEVVEDRDHLRAVLGSLNHYANALEQMSRNLRAVLPTEEADHG